MFVKFSEFAPHALFCKFALHALFYSNRASFERIF